MKLVMKFGGGLLTSGTRIRESALLVKKQVDEGNDVVVVTSAMGGVTDCLLKVLEDLSRCEEDEVDSIIEAFCDGLERDHLSAVREAGNQENLEKVDRKISNLMHLLKEYLKRFAKGDRSPHRREEIVAMGELLSSPIFAVSLSSLGIRAEPLTGGEAGIVTDSNFGNAWPKMEVCRKSVRDRLGGLIGRGITPVVTGFVAQDGSGVITTLGRGGSDYTASILGSCLGVDEIWIWKDVGGIMTANPKVVADARTIPTLSYSEAADLAHFGAKVLHPRTMAPVIETGIPIRVKDATRPDRRGTLISSQTIGVKSSVKAVTSVDRVGLIAISGTGMVGVPGVAARVFDALARGNVNVMMISQSSSETNITIVVPKDDIPVCRRLVGEEFQKDDIIGDIKFEEDISIVSVVGSGMKGTPGVAAKVFRSVAKAGVNVIMIAQGSSEVNLSFVVRRKDAEKVVLSIHGEFKLNELFLE